MAEGTLQLSEKDESFVLKSAENTNYLYFPIAGEAGLKACVTPNLGGDSKLDQEHFVLEPVSVENLHNNKNTRNFWLNFGNGKVWSAVGSSAEQEAERFTDAQEESRVEGGFLWQKAVRESKKYGIEAEVTSFVPVEANVEIMRVKLRNTSDNEVEFTPVAVIPLYGRSADNLRDHRNVTSMLHRVSATEDGVQVKPTMSFDEKGHRLNHLIYYVHGSEGSGDKAESFFPTTESLIGEGGSFLRPEAVIKDKPGMPAGTKIDGREAVGGLKFKKKTLAPGEECVFILRIGVEEEEGKIVEADAAYGTDADVIAALEKTGEYWKNKVNVHFHTGDSDFDNFMFWVSFQPFLRRIYGCSFLPYHDYGRGGRGWRDLWQDCLSLLFMEPDDVRKMIVANFGGVRADGTNATIIGDGIGNFIADRNGIARVWMDHAFWPFRTLKLYIDQTGDIGILDETAGYFKDPQASRATAIDTDWKPEDGNQLKTADGKVYSGSIIEHLLVETLTAFCEVGEHGIIRLRGADWNDALDMAAKRGESVAFTFAYAMNLVDIADTLEEYSAKTGKNSVAVAKELKPLIEMDEATYGDSAKKLEALKTYCDSCVRNVSGEQAEFDISRIVSALRKMAEWQKDFLRSQEWIDGKGDEGWFNSYYDDHGNRVEKYTENDEDVRMMLTGQVFAVMSGTAEEDRVARIAKAADHYLYRKEIGGYRLNTDFRELKMDMGRMFGFSYGEKENGAVFSHMAVMYGNALYTRGFAKEGYKVLKALSDTSLDFEVSRMYPGIPEYFNIDGRGMYPYLTGAASWYMMTMILEVYGVRGKNGDLAFAPRLLAEQFDQNGEAEIELCFAGKPLKITYKNPKKLEYKSYRVASVTVNGETKIVGDGEEAVIARSEVESFKDSVTDIIIVLE
ncbi:MAG: cellobiose phosphorylase [Lachnospiraceae bacterium]|nr:cellobiose phosphorylase [Lachnospiraceae bacterium]